MALLRCKMCGGDMIIDGTKNIGTCEYCGCSMTIPKSDNTDIISMFNSGNEYRIAGEFDRALQIFDGIIKNDDTNAEAHWGAVLCKYGIEYVEDPATLEMIPTCHRLSSDSVLQDVDYKKALEYSDGIASRIYEREAKKINVLQKKIFEISQKEEPYDIFISYKETDSYGQRTEDSVIAQDIYDKLTEKGFRVFFSKISLESKLGEEYEPYIFAALNSAKIMLAVGCSTENINAPWVRNEWSRYLALAKNNKDKMLIPCFKNISPSDLPPEMSLFQAQDLGKLGFLQDLIRGIEKILDCKTIADVSINNMPMNSNAIVSTKIKRAYQLVEDKDYYKATAMFDSILESDINCSMAYVGLLLCDLKLTCEEDLKNVSALFADNNNYQRALKTADEEYKKTLTNYCETAKENFVRSNGLSYKYEKYREEYLNPTEKTDYFELYKFFKELTQVTGGWKDSEKLYNECYKKDYEIKKQQRKYLSDTRNQFAILKPRVIVHSSFVACLRENGTVAVAGSGKDSINKTVSKWRDIVHINTNLDGSIIVGLNSKGDFICNVNLFTKTMSKYKYTKVAAGKDSVYGICVDGNVFGIKENREVELFKGNKITDIYVIDSSNSVLALDENGKFLTTDSILSKKIQSLKSQYYKFVYYGREVYALTRLGVVETTNKKFNCSQFVNIYEIGIFSGKLYGLNSKWAVVSSDLTQALPHKPKSNFDDKVIDYSYWWSQNLLDFAVCKGIMYGLKPDGSVLYSKRETKKVNNFTFIATYEYTSEEYKNAIAIYAVSDTFVVLLRDGRVVCNNKNIDLSSWKLFADINKLDENNEEKRKNAIINGNDLVAEDKLLLHEQEELQAVNSSLDELEEMITGLTGIKLQSEDEVKILYSIIAQCKSVLEDLKGYKKVNTDKTAERVKSLSEKISSVLADNGRANERVCPKCGNLLRPGKRFCSKCGYKLSDAELR